MIGLLRALLFVALTLCGGAAARAHESLPLVVTVTERTEHGYTLETRLPGNVPPSQAPQLQLDGPCEGVAASRIVRCLDRPAALLLRWHSGTPASAILVRSAFQNGQSASMTAPAGSTRIALPETETAWGVLRRYFGIGVDHILFGFDHLLFLLCLVLIAGEWRRTAITVTGFTLGHAVTICLATLGNVRVNGGAVEAVIALSIAFLAAELVRGRKNGLTFRYPALVATGFGLLHGLGFAGALSEIGIAQTQVALSLAGFNFGVEAGQLLFVAAVLGLVAASRTYASPAWQARSDRLRATMLLAIGVLAAYWFVERGVGILA
ncbi:HupE/UreJ family protein [Croceicoccus hydrothermalis]|uniref:HupE/UreJ family protein n=1 Tax=Croceicoccus hydrothermalis TaxID=2867964 RepID=UPI001EFB9791|nr:HupE/UreJ family protein [Croceicoccus hydrothermalis]